MNKNSYLTVEDLIKILHTYPQDMYVANDCGILKREDIKTMKDFYVGEGSTDFEKNPIDEVVYIN